MVQVASSCASERKIGVMSGHWRIPRTAIELGLFKRMLVLGLVLGAARFESSSLSADFSSFSPRTQPGTDTTQ